MPQSQMRAVRANGAALGITQATTLSNSETTLVPPSIQRLCAATWLARRFAMPLSTAQAVAEANGLGGVA